MVNIAIAVDAHQTSLLKPEHVVCLLQLPTGTQSWLSFVVAVFQYCCSWVPIGTAIQIFQTEALEENGMIQLCCLIMDYIPNNIIDQTFYVYSEAILAARDKPHSIMPVKNNWMCYSSTSHHLPRTALSHDMDYSRKSKLATYFCSFAYISGKK